MYSGRDNEVDDERRGGGGSTREEEGGEEEKRKGDGDTADRNERNGDYEQHIGDSKRATKGNLTGRAKKQNGSAKVSVLESRAHKRSADSGLHESSKKVQIDSAQFFAEVEDGAADNGNSGVETFTILDLDERPIDDYSIYFFTNSQKTNIGWINEYLAGFETIDEKRNFLSALCRMMCGSSDSQCLEEALAHANDERVVCVNSMVEVGILVLFQFFIKYQRKDKCWLVVDLPPGVGKSFEIERLFPLFTEFYNRQYNDNFERVLITTPTAKTRIAYSFARVLHSQMGLPIRKPELDARRYVAAIAEALEKPNIAHRIKLARVLVFDEMSMYSQELLFPVLNKFRDKFCILIGDSCQLPPVMGGAINWDVDGELYKQFPVAYKCEPGSNIRILRFETAAKLEPGSHEAKQQWSLRQLLLNLRQVIAQQIRAKRATGKNATSQIKDEWLIMWYSKFCQSFHVEEELTLDRVIESLVESQRFVNSLVAWLGQDDNFYEHLSENLDNLTETLASASRRLNQHFHHFQLPIVIGYENSFNFEVFDRLAGQDLVGKTGPSPVGKTGQNCWRPRSPGEKETKCCTLRSVLMLASDASNPKQVEYVQNNVAPNLMNSRNTLYPGMFIRCRENNAKQGIYNGQVGIFVGFFYDNSQFESGDAQPIFDTTCITKLAQPGRGKQQHLVADELTIIKFNKHLSVNMQTLARSLNMVFFDVDKQCLKSCHPTVKYLCEQCERARRNEVKSSSSYNQCTFHQTGRRPVQYLYFSWTSNYAQTVFCVQGATLSNEKMYLLGNTVLKNNILRTLYVVLSRCRSSDQIHVDQNFVLKALRAIFNKPMPLLSEKLNKLKMDALE